ncbi:MAG: DUF2179 domain-containing protein, partial [Firmicutes bacterium]|nr:DUF2179 domain-containing protein [Bacillota bacterium]
PRAGARLTGVVAKGRGPGAGNEQPQWFLDGYCWKCRRCVSRRELARLKQQVRQLDPGAFMVVQDATEVIGEGFGAIVPPHGPGPTPLRVGRRLPRLRRRTQPPHQRPEIVRDGGPQA